jgi:hypothetical protein
MNWYSSMYLSDSVRARAGQLMKEMEEERFSRRIWVLSIPLCERDQLDIRRASSLAYHGLWETIPMIVGLAGSRMEAVELVQQIARDCMATRGDASLREYLTGTR